MNGGEPRMRVKRGLDNRGKIGYMLAWALGVPIPVLLIIYMLRGCN
jgi:hypothetical protein